MEYLFSAYTLFFLLLAGYIFSIDRRQKKIDKEIKLLQDLLKK